MLAMEVAAGVIILDVSEFVNTPIVDFSNVPIVEKHYTTEFKICQYPVPALCDIGPFFFEIRKIFSLTDSEICDRDHRFLNSR